jgi:cytochrome bd-type quinol oxidase subunit 1
MEFDALLLSRLQFAFTIGFHIIFPAFTIGLASFLAVLHVRIGVAQGGGPGLAVAEEK